MAEFAERVVGLVAEPDYRPITLKAMSRHLEVQPDAYAEFRRAVKGLIREGKLHLARDKTLSLPDRSGMIVGLFRRSAKGFGFVRPQGAGARDRPGLHPARGHARRLERRRSHGQDHPPARRGGLSAEGRVVEVLTRAAEVFVGTLFRGRRDQLRQGRRHDVPRSDLGG